MFLEFVEKSPKWKIGLKYMIIYEIDVGKVGIIYSLNQGKVTRKLGTPEALSELLKQ